METSSPSPLEPRRNRKQASAYRTAVPPDTEEARQFTQLTFSGFCRPAIVLSRAAATLRNPSSGPIRLAWWPAAISLRNLAHLLDGLILLTAVLLFSLLSLSGTQVLPTWPVGLALLVSVTLLFAGLYKVLFGICGGTPGEYLAELAGGGSKAEGDREETRFR